MNDCLFCGKEVVSKEGKKPRQFCNGNCRNKYYYKLSNTGKEPKRKGRKPKSGVTFGDTKLVGIATFAPDGTKGVIKIDPPIVLIKAPKNLTELKAMCPTNLTGFDKSQWVSNNRQKYGI